MNKMSYGASPSASIYSPGSARHEVYGGPHTLTVSQSAPAPPAPISAPPMGTGGLAIQSTTLGGPTQPAFEKEPIKYGSCDDYEYPEWYCERGYTNHEDAAMGENRRANVHKGVNWVMIILGILLLGGLITFLLLFLKRNKDANTKPNVGDVHVEVVSDTSITVSWNRDQVSDAHELGIIVTDSPPTSSDFTDIPSSNRVNPNVGTKTIIVTPPMTGDLVYVSVVPLSNTNAAIGNPNTQKVALQVSSDIASTSTDKMFMMQHIQSGNMICVDTTGSDPTLTLSKTGVISGDPNACSWTYKDNKVCSFADDSNCLSINGNNPSIADPTGSNVLWQYNNNFWCQQGSGSVQCLTVNNNSLNLASINPATATSSLQRWVNPLLFLELTST